MMSAGQAGGRGAEGHPPLDLRNGGVHGEFADVVGALERHHDDAARLVDGDEAPDAVVAGARELGRRRHAVEARARRPLLVRRADARARLAVVQLRAVRGEGVAGKRLELLRVWASW
ncbi:hypothetical protein OCS_03729 [Ophiocordyceps sinensis CO18]|uniref:Uncharacterized protein n=1 Tax=Ophiocordyceps sinensis (strain Co18 / CGMCC 3.14243) TaxID=911162 RepID=T5ADR5_OPHSC|nr:hypothetical protein OCS_03729 [Ophiocordyceps sinensis CO18]